MALCYFFFRGDTIFDNPVLHPPYVKHWLQRAEAVTPPLGESLPNPEIFRRLAARFGFDDPCFKASDAALMDEAVDAADPRLAGARPSEISTGDAVPMTASDGKPIVLFENVFPSTPSGKVELKSEALATRWGDGALYPEWRERPAVSAYPLMLISPASDKRISSTLGSIGGSKKAPLLMMHPEDAATRGLTAGDVRVWNERGEGVLPLAGTDKVPRGVV